MARTKGPLMSLDASGTIGKTITHSSWKGRTYARHRVDPTKTNTREQQLQRYGMQFLSQAWTVKLSDTDRAAWAPLATPTNVSPFNAYIGDNLASVKQGIFFHERPDRSGGTTDITFGTGPAAQGQVKQATVTWTPTAVNDVWCLIWLRSDNVVIHPTTDPIVGISIPFDALTGNMVNKNAPPGHYWYYCIGLAVTGDITSVTICNDVFVTP